MEQIFNVFGNILKTIDSIESFTDLSANNAQASITLEDTGRIVRTELSTLFEKLEVSDLQGTHNNFYGVWLPSITSRTTTTADDINDSAGSLHATFHHLIDGIRLTQRSLNTLETIYKLDSPSFHIDDFVQGVFAFTELYGLLLHMHSAYATLRHISMGATTLDDPVLLLDTMGARSYAKNAIAIINWMRARAIEKRFDTNVFTPVRQRWILTTSYQQQWYYEDRYETLSATPEKYRILVASPAAWHSETVWGESSAVVRKRVENLRERRRQGLAHRFSQMITSDCSEVVRRLEEFDEKMTRRETSQIQGGRREGRATSPFIESQLAIIKDMVLSRKEHPEKGADAASETRLASALGVNEYREWSEYLCDSRFGIKSGEPNTKIKTAESTEAVYVCLHCNSTSSLPITAGDTTVAA